MESATNIAQSFICRHWRAGDGLDATAGNGHDTRFLAENMPAGAHVYACDIQPQALVSTRMLLTSKGLEARVSLYQADHSALVSLLPEGIALGAAMFNLGYLPHGDHAITTSAISTLSALRGLLPLLIPGGLATIVYYTGHAGGQEEADAVLDFAVKLPEDAYAVRHIPGPELRNNPPGVVVILKQGSSQSPITVI